MVWGNQVLKFKRQSVLGGCWGEVRTVFLLWQWVKTLHQYEIVGTIVLRFTRLAFRFLDIQGECSLEHVFCHKISPFFMEDISRKPLTKNDKTYPIDSETIHNILRKILWNTRIASYGKPPICPRHPRHITPRTSRPWAACGFPAQCRSPWGGWSGKFATKLTVDIMIFPVE